MLQADRDAEQLRLIVDYCNRLDHTLEFFGDDEDRFFEQTPFQDSCALGLIQIGESVNRLSDDFKDSHPQISWHSIYGMRNHLVHAYGLFDAEICWDALHNDIPALKCFCESVVNDRPSVP